MRTAMEKISSAAMIAADRGNAAAVFKDGCPLDVAAFSGLLRRNFGLKFTPAELGATPLAPACLLARAPRATPSRVGGGDDSRRRVLT
jgi:hypothetical protein